MQLPHPRFCCALLASLISVSISLPLEASSVDIRATANKTIYSQFPAFDTYLRIGEDNKQMNTLLQFDISQEVVDASVVLWNYTQSNSDAVTASIYKVTQPWNESATWTSTGVGSMVWTMPGGAFEPTPIASATISGSFGQSIEWTSPALTTLVNEWVSDPSTNYGLLLKVDTPGTSTRKNFYSLQEPPTAPADRLPKITVTLLGIPEPSTFQPLGVAILGMAMLVRRRTRLS